MDAHQLNREALQKVAETLRMHEIDEFFEGRDDFFDLFVEIYEDELSDAYARKAVPPKPTVVPEGTCPDS